MSRDEAVAARLEREKALVRRMLKHLATRGFKPTVVFDGEVEHKVTKVAEVIKHVFAVDWARVYFGDACSVVLVIGNDEDLVSDWAWPMGTGWSSTKFNPAMDEFLAAEDKRK